MNYLWAFVQMASRLIPGNIAPILISNSVVLKFLESCCISRQELTLEQNQNIHFPLVRTHTQTPHNKTPKDTTNWWDIHATLPNCSQIQVDQLHVLKQMGLILVFGDYFFSFQADKLFEVMYLAWLETQSSRIAMSCRRLSCLHIYLQSGDHVSTPRSKWSKPDLQRNV
jgi:hypothetical protein